MSDKTVPPKKKMPFGKRLVFAFIAAGIFIAACESACRYTWHILYYKPSSDQELQKDIFWEDAWKKDVPYLFPPGKKGRIGFTKATINNLGFRGNDVSPAEISGSVLCVGDSVTFGYNASDDSHAYPALLEDLLKVKGFGGKVINAGMPRYRLEHVCNMLEHMHPGLRPKAMIILGGWNDIQDKILKPERTAFSNFLDWVRQDVYLYKTPNRIINGPHSDGLALRLSARIDCGGVDEYVKSANRLILIAKAQGAMPVICTLPHFYENIKDEAAELKFGKFHTYGTRPQIIEAVNLVNARIGKLAESGNVLLIDLSAVDSPDRFDDAVHPNDSGNAAIAKIICEKLAPLIAD